METFILFTDGSAIPNPGPCGAGAVMINSKNEIVWTLSEFLGDGTNNIGELTAILRGVMRAMEMGITQLKIYSDSELSIALITGEKTTKKEHLQYIVTRIQKIIQKNTNVRVTFEWIKAHNNHKWNDMADEFANKAIPSLNTNVVIKPTSTTSNAIQATTRLDIRCPFSEKDTVKKLGARWDPEKKLWWTLDTPENREKFAQWLSKT